MECSPDYAKIQSVDTRILDTLNLFHTMRTDNPTEFVSLRTFEPLKPGLVISLVAISIPEAMAIWNTTRSEGVINMGDDDLPTCAPCAQIIGLEPGSNDMMRNITADSRFGQYMIRNGWGRNVGNRIELNRQNTNDQAVRRNLFESTVLARDKAMLDNFSVGATQLWMSQGGMGGRLIAGSPPDFPDPDWQAVWDFYTGGPLPALKYGSAYLDSPPYPANEPSSANVIRWLTNQFGNINVATERYSSAGYNYKDNLSRTVRIAKGANSKWASELSNIPNS